MKRRQFLNALPLFALFRGMGNSASARAGETNPFAGFWMPEESAPHTRTFMQWPVSRTVHPDPYFLALLQKSIADIANTIVEFEPVVMLMDRRHEDAARLKLGVGVEIWDVPTEDLWCRDTGPVFLRNRAGGLAIVNLNFNGWGNKQIHEFDGKVSQRLATRLGLSFLDTGVIGEAGGLESDGQGTLIAHRSSWVNPNRNHLTESQIENRLLAAYGARKMIWANGIMNADITDYHIDSLARFVRPGTILMQMPDKVYRDDPWSKAAFETYETLKSASDAAGRRLNIVVIPDPETSRITASNFVSSYVNYYVCNGAVIVAQFGDGNSDEIAREKLRQLYPGREIVTLNIDPIGEVGGGIHCATQQQPVGRPL